MMHHKQSYRMPQTQDKHYEQSARSTVRLTPYNKILISMKNLYTSNATIDTHPFSNTSLHNCPTCRCKSTEHSNKLNCSISQPYLRQHRNQQQNLYLYKEVSEAPSTERISFRPYQSTVFQSPTNKIQFKYSNAVSSKPTNISFSYTSPPKMRKHHSSEARFSTKRFKEARFPQISRDDIDNIQVKMVVKDVKSQYYEVAARDKTPEKHRVLKMKKERTKKTNPVNNSNTNSSHQQSDSIPDSNTAHHNEYEMSGPSNTPINALWIHASQKTHKELTNQEINRMTNKNNQPASIEYIEAKVSSKSIKPVHNSERQMQETTIEPVLERQTNKKYPTLQSLDIYENNRYNDIHSQRAATTRPKEEETSLRYIKEPRQSYESQDIQIARSISEQLQLNFDYYYPNEESDRSLSLHVDL